MKYALILSILLTGCATRGLPYKESNVPKNNAQIVIYRPSSGAAMMRTPSIKYKGETTCDLHLGSYFTINEPAGSALISADLWDMPGTSSVKFKTEPGHRYYVSVEFQDRSTPFGAVGALLKGDEHLDDGPFKMRQHMESDALVDLPYMKQGSCK